MNRSRLTIKNLRTTDKPSAPSFINAWPWWSAPALLSLILALVFIDPFIGDWDALDYTTLALQGRPSSMLFGRALFIYTNHALWLVAHALFDLPPEKAYLLFKYAVVLQSPLTVICWWVLARDLTGSKPAATVSVLLLSLSPFFILYSGQAMTEIPALLLLGVALVIHLRGVRRQSILMVLLGAALLGLGLNVREAAALYAPWLVIAPFVFGWKLGRREIALTALACLVFLIFAAGGIAYFYLTDLNGYRGQWHNWLESTRAESARHPPTLGNIGPLMLYFFMAAPLVLVAFPVAAFAEWRRRGLSPLLALALTGFLANLTLIVHYGVVINARYILTGLPALTPLVADYFMRTQTAKAADKNRAFASVVLGVVLIASLFGYHWWPSAIAYARARATAKDYLERLALVPRDAVMISGGQTVAVNYWRGIGMGQWDTIGTGVGWPGEQFPSVIEKYLNEGRRVFMDADPRWWTPCGWQLPEVRALVGLESRFRFRRLSETIYEIRPVWDETARDEPNLQRLLPENRPDEVRYCSG